MDRAHRIREGHHAQDKPCAVATDYFHRRAGFDSGCLTIEAFVPGCIELEESANEWIVGAPELFVRAFEDDPALMQHHDLCIHEAQLVAFPFDFHFIAPGCDYVDIAS